MQHANLTPPSWAVGVGLVVLLTVVALTLTHGGLDARLAWGTLVVTSLLSIGLLAVQRQGTLAASLDLIHRHGADAALVLTLVVAAALRQTPAPSFSALPVARLRDAAPRRRELVVAVAAAVALVASAAVSTPALAAPLMHDDDRAFVTAAREALREDRTAVVLDGGAPPGVLSPWFGEAARVSTVLARAPESPVFDLPSRRLRIVRLDGSLSPVVLTGSVDMVPTDDEACPDQCVSPARSSPSSGPYRSVAGSSAWATTRPTPGSSSSTSPASGSRSRCSPASTRSTYRSPQVSTSCGSLSSTRGDTLCIATATVGVPTASPGGGP